MVVIDIGRKSCFDYDQCSRGQIAFCSYVLGQIALYISPKSNLWKKNKTSLIHVQLLSGIRCGSSAIFEHKNVHTMHFLFIFKLLVAKRGGEIFDNHYLPSGEHKKFILDCQSAPVLKS